MPDGALYNITRHICRFCGTHEQSKHMITRDPLNHWSAAICEDCIDQCAAALSKLRRKR